MDSELLTALLWFGLGTLSYRLVSYLIGYTRNLLMIQKTVVGLLFMLKYYNECLESDSELLVNSIKSKNADGGQQTEKLVNLSLEIWRTQSIRSIKNYVPPQLAHFVSFNTWKEAMHFLRKYESRM